MLRCLKGKKFDVVSDSIFETLSDTKTPQGMLAVVKQQPYSFEELLGKERASFLLILDHLQDPGNLGTIMRASWGGRSDWYFNEQMTVLISTIPKDEYEALWVLFTACRLSYQKDCFAGDIERLKKAGVSTYAAAPRRGNQLAKEQTIKSLAHLLIGNEANGPVR